MMCWRSWNHLRLENASTILRPFSVDDVEQLCEIAFDPNIWEYFIFRLESKEEVEAFVAQAISDTETGARAAFCVFDKNTNHIAGSMCYGNFAPTDRRLEIGWSWLGVEYQGTGVNGAAKYLLLSHAFEVLNCERVEFKTDVLNKGARRGLTKIGAKEEGVLRSYNYMPSGRRRDAVYYSILNHEWPSAKSLIRENYNLVLEEGVA